MTAGSSARTFHVTAIWDAEAGVFYSETDIPGLVVEAATFDDFVDLVNALAPDMLSGNLPELAKPYRVTVSARRDLILAVA